MNRIIKFFYTIISIIKKIFNKSNKTKTMAKHYIVTNREIINEGTDNEYIREDGREEARDELRYGYYEFDENNSKDKGKITLIPDPSEDDKRKHKKTYEATDGIALGSEKVFKELYESMSSANEKGDVITFIHGFKNDLDVALETVRELHEK